MDDFLSRAKEVLGAMPVIDWLVVLGYLVITMWVGLGFARRAGKGVEEFFLAGRKLPWWLAGASMVAAMFASDTPLFHSGNVRDMGLSAAWLFFFPCFGTLFAGAYFARLVRRTRVVTDAELVELRYSGSAPAPFRGFLALYNGIYVAGLTMGWVTLGMTETASQILSLPKLPVIVFLMVLVLVYSMVSGLWGVVMADLFQYIIASVGSLYLAVASVRAAGGLSGLREGLARIPSYPGSDLHFLPTFTEGLGSKAMVVMTLPLALAWILIHGASYASATQHQGQRILACRHEKDASLTYIMYCFCYFALNGVSWVVVGLASVVVLGPTNEAAGLANSSRAFPAMVKQLMPVGMLGLMVASIFAAFMSTASVVLNWGSSYLINDLYRRFIVKEASPRHYVNASRIASLLLGVWAAYFAMVFESLGEFFSMVPQLLTGAVLVLLARYLWWRTNIWSEVSAIVISPFIGLYVEFVLGARRHISWLESLPGYGIWDAATVNGNDWHFWGQRLFAAVGGTTACWLIVTFLTRPTEIEKLKAFYVLVRPSGPGWGPVRRRLQQPPTVEPVGTIFMLWIYSIVFVMGSICALVELIRGNLILVVLWAVGAAVTGVLMMRALETLNRSSEAADAVAAARAAGATIRREEEPAR